MLVTGRRVDAEEAFVYGLVEKIADDSVATEAIDRVRTIARAIDSQLNSTRE
jgi:enoyl-CoA hydratase/carnithine racemase